MNNKICIRQTVGVQPTVNKKLYVRPDIETLSLDSSCTLLSSSQDPWADAKPHIPKFDNNFWNDETNANGNANKTNEENWAGYKENMSIW